MHIWLVNIQKAKNYKKQYTIHILEIVLLLKS